MIVITDEYIKEHGFKEYDPTRFDNDSVILRFQKRYDDDFGKKYIALKDVHKLLDDRFEKHRLLGQ